MSSSKNCLSWRIFKTNFFRVRKKNKDKIFLYKVENKFYSCKDHFQFFW